MQFKNKISFLSLITLVLSNSILMHPLLAFEDKYTMEQTQVVSEPALPDEALLQKLEAEETLLEKDKTLATAYKSIEDRKKERLEIIHAFAKQLNVQLKSDEEIKWWGLLGTQIYHTVTAYEKGDPQWKEAGGLPPVYFKDEKMWLHVAAYEDSTQKLEDIVEENEGIVTASLDGIEAEILLPIKQVKKVADQVESLSLVQFVKPNGTATPAWRTTNASWWHEAGGVTGDGNRGGDGRPIRIAVIDYFNPSDFPRLARMGLLPNLLDIARGSRVDYGGVNGWHGNLMLTIIHKIAPGAILLPVSIGNTTLINYTNGLEAAIELNPDIISSSVGKSIDRFASSSGEFPGPITQEISNAFARNILTIVSSGNEGLPRKHWSGVFKGTEDQNLYLNWNTQTDVLESSPPTSSSPPSDRLARSNLPGNILLNDIGCFSTGQQIIVEAGFPPADAGLFEISVFRYLPLRREWKLITSNMTTSSVKVINYVTRPNTEIITPFNNELSGAPAPDGSCDTSQGRYAIAISRINSGLATYAIGDPRNYINVFTENLFDFGFRVYNTSVSLNESSMSMHAVTVGAADCEYMGENTPCDIEGAALYSSIGPALYEMRKPTKLDGRLLAFMSNDYISPFSVKPDFVAPSPYIDRNVLRPIDITNSSYGGSSSSTAVTAGLSALLLDRYPVLKRNPREAKLALIKLARRNLQSGAYTSAMSPMREPMADPRLDPNHAFTLASYSHGRGYLTLEKERQVEMRGRPNHTWTNNRTMTSSPEFTATRGTVNANGREAFLPASEYPRGDVALLYRWGDGLGPDTTFYFSPSIGTGMGLPLNILNGTPDLNSENRVMFPVLKPRVEYIQSTPVYTFTAGEAEQLMPTSSSLPSSYTSFLRMAGEFKIPLRFSLNPGQNIDISQGRNLTMRAVRRDGTAVPTTAGSLPQTTSADFSICRVGYNPTGNICPALP